MKKSGQNA